MLPTRRRRVLSGIALAAALGVVAIRGTASAPAAQGQMPGLRRVAAVSRDSVRAWDAEVDRLARRGELELRLDREDTLVSGRRHQRFRQTRGGVPIYGADVTRQLDADGLTVSIFGTLHVPSDVATEPALSADDAQAIVTARTGAALGARRVPRLAILPRGDGQYALVYTARVASGGDITLLFVDARTGRILHERSDAHTQAAVGVGTGVLGDRKKVSASAQGGTFASADRLRPPVIETYDMRGNLPRTLAFLNDTVSLGASDLAADSDNQWTDGATVDAHTYAGYTYDYYYKRFGRRGLDNADIPIRGLTHPVSRSDLAHAPGPVINLFFVNAFYAGDGIMVYGEGLPPDVFTPGGRTWDYLAGGFDVVAHELTHGVTDYSSQLVYENESGALNEAFSDIMATAVEFFFQEAGTGVLRADYLIGEDVIRPGGLRSMEDPARFGDPDHYSRRYTGQEDNGGVHINSGIVSHAYYLAVEGGINRTSGLAVHGVGRSSREQMERVFYRAFTQMMPATATFSTARAATIQAARDLFGGGSAAERAVTEAWTAVGVT